MVGWKEGDVVVVVVEEGEAEGVEEPLGRLEKMMEPTIACHTQMLMSMIIEPRMYLS